MGGGSEDILHISLGFSLVSTLQWFFGAVLHVASVKGTGQYRGYRGVGEGSSRGLNRCSRTTRMVNSRTLLMSVYEAYDICTYD